MRGAETGVVLATHGDAAIILSETILDGVGVSERVKVEAWAAVRQAALK